MGREVHDAVDRAEARAAAAVQEMDLKLRAMELQLWSVVEAAGGTVVVPRSLLARMDKPHWTITRDDANDCVRYQVSI